MNWNPINKIIRPSSDLIGIPKKDICTWGASLLAIPKKISAINMAMRGGAAKRTESVKIVFMSSIAIFQNTF